MSKQRAIIGGAVGAILGLAAGVGRCKSRRKPRNIFFRVAPPPPRGGMHRPVKPRLSEALAPTHPLVRWVEGYKKGETTWESL